MEPGVNILFVGAEGKMEMDKVPQAGFEITGLPVKGFKRKLSVYNFRVLKDLLISIRKARKLLNGFKADVVVGTGGYASGPVVFEASRKNIPALIQEQNSFPGVTNKILARTASKICVAYPGMEKYFPVQKIVVTGNPVRDDLQDNQLKKEEAMRHFKLDTALKTLLILGGSLGAKTINESVTSALPLLMKEEIQVIWQCGSIYYETAKAGFETANPSNMLLRDFILRMDLAYAAADLVISRAGAGTISELALTAKPVILVPSPNVAEDHQTKNAMILAQKEAAKLVRDEEAPRKLLPMAVTLIKRDDILKSLSENINKIAVPDSAMKIAGLVLQLAEHES